jgi:transcriptional regulator with XRE-family HTH domain
MAQATREGGRMMQSLEFKDRLRAARKAKGWTLATLARKTGITEGHISHCEDGKFIPKMNTLMYLADALEVSMDWLSGRLGYDDGNEIGKCLQQEQIINALVQIDKLAEQLNGLRDFLKNDIYTIKEEELVE